MGLIMLGQMSFLAEALAAKRAGERFLAGVRSDVHVHAVLVLEALATDAAVVQGALFPLHAARRAAGTAGLLLIRVAAAFRAGAAVASAIGVVIVAIRASDILLRRFRSDADSGGRQLQLVRLLLLLLVYVGSLNGLRLQYVLLGRRNDHGA